MPARFASAFSVPRTITFVAALAYVLAGPARAEDAPDLRSLYAERVATLRKLVEVATRQYQAGMLTQSEVLDAAHRLAAAEVDAAETPAQRLAALERAVEAARKREADAAARFRAGLAMQTEELAARAARLQAQIELAKEKAAEPAKAK